MPRLSTGSLEFSIRGDELEQHRIQLEQNLQHTDLSLHLSSTPGDQSDVEYPRHNAAPDQFNGFASFDRMSRDNFDPDESHYNAWSYRTGDDEHGVNPYENRTVSTAAHHASALTLSAGLGGRGIRRDVSVSGAEYDPDRPLTGIIAGMGSRLPNLDVDSTKSRHIASATVDFDPVVVDDSAELDEVLQHGRAPIPVSGLRSPSSSSSSSRPNTPMSPRPKLSDALHQVAFSPKRPRNMPSPATRRTASTHVPSGPKSRTVSSRHPQRSASTRARAATVHTDDEDENPTPRSRSKANSSHSHVIYAQSLSYAAIEPEVNVHPPTPPNEESGSRFTRMARGIAREIEEQSRQETSGRRDREVAQSTLRERNPARNNRVPLRSVVSELQDNPPPRPRSAGQRTPRRNGRVYLPDVTGLTSAVASPAKLGLDYRTYDAREDREIDVRLATTLNVVQSKLAYLESENSISRRRVRELELELEECKKDVARERTRILEREQSMRQHDEESARRERAAAQARQAREAELQNEADIKRYKEVVQQKKALEGLVSTLRAHLSRLTEELADHSRILQELRTLRDSDVRALKDKSDEVNALRQEVERLAGEVEVLRGVVEEGLKERREIREQSIERDRSLDHSAVGPILDGRADITDLSVQQAEEEAASDSDGSSSGRSTPSPRPSPVRRPRFGDGTMRTDVATVGSSPQDAGLYGTPFVDSEDLQRISEEVSERRSERSSSASNTTDNSRRSVSRHTLPMASYSEAYEPRTNGQRYRHDSDSESDTAVRPLKGKAPERPLSRQSSVQGPTRTSTPVRDPSPEPSTSRVPPPKQSNPPKQSRQPKAESSKAAAAATQSEAPFPQIRGERLEQLFFSAPEHNAHTCTVCNRRRRAKSGHRRTSWSSGRPLHADGEDEGFEEGFEDAKPKWNYKGKEREHAGEDRLPPQTVLARVLRELEDDFSHYKSIYIELADQYKVIDPISNVAKRNVLAEHLREVIDVLEQKGDQIASLYDLLTFGDKPVEQAATRPSGARAKA